MKFLRFFTLLPARYFLPLIMLIVIVIALITSYVFMKNHQVEYLKKSEAQSISYSFKSLIKKVNQQLGSEHYEDHINILLDIYASSNSCDVGLFNETNTILYTNNPTLKLWTAPYMKMLRSFAHGDIVWKKKHFLSYHALNHKGLYLAYHKDLDFASGEVQAIAVDMLKIFTLVLFISTVLFSLLFYFLVTKRVAVLLELIKEGINNPKISFNSSFEGRDEISMIAMAFKRLLLKVQSSHKEMQESLDKFDLLNEASPDGIFILSSEYKVLHYNQQLLNFLNICDADIMSIDLRSKLGSNKESIKKLFEKVSLGSDVDIETVCRQSFGEHLAIRLRLRAIEIDGLSYILGFITDTSKEEEQKKLLTESEHNFQAILDEMYTFVAVLDVDGHVEFINQRVLKDSEIGLSDVKGKIFYELPWWSYNSDMVKELKEDFIRVGEGITIRKDLQIEIQKDQFLWIDFALHPAYDKRGNIIHLVAEAIDITSKKRALKEMLQQSRKAQMGEMLSIIAHQWKQPLSVIATISSSVKFELLFDERDVLIQEQMDKIESTVSHLTDTMHTFTHFFNPNKVRNSTNMRTIVDKCLALMNDTLKKLDIDVTISIENDEDFLSFEDELIQVLMDIIKNALDFLEHNTFGTPSLKLIQEKSDETISLSVIDNAGGIPDEVLPKLFDPYFSTKDSESGTGLGLHMSKIIVEEHCQGKIEAIQMDDGACFKITLPLNPID